MRVFVSWSGPLSRETAEALRKILPLLAAVDQTPDITIEELRAIMAEQNVTASHGAVWNLLARHGLTVKKDGACQPNHLAKGSRPPLSL